MTEFDVVNKPKHYNSHPSGVECITVTEHMNVIGVSRLSRQITDVEDA